MTFARFVLVGLLGAALQLALIAAGIATPISVEAAVLHNFVWHDRFTWPGRKDRIAVRLLRFHLANGMVSILGNSFLMYCMVERFKLPILLSGATSIALCSLINFRLAGRWVFR
jgi:putative flippase GtrA